MFVWSILPVIPSWHVPVVTPDALDAPPRATKPNVKKAATMLAAIAGLTTHAPRRNGGDR